jgi:hypothetical protein
MNLEEYTLALGKIVVNLHSLEFALRMFLWNQESPHGPSNWKTKVPQLQVGQSVPVNAFTNYDSLKELIEKFNVVVQKIDPSLCVDLGVVSLRDALAHGRVSAQVPQPPMQLIKFSKPSNGLVTVTYAEYMDEQWLQSHVTRVRSEIAKVAKAGQLMQPSKWPAAT